MSFNTSINDGFNALQPYQQYGIADIVTLLEEQRSIALQALQTQTDRFAAGIAANKTLYTDSMDHFTNVAQVNNALIKAQGLLNTGQTTLTLDPKKDIIAQVLDLKTSSRNIVFNLLDVSGSMQESSIMRSSKDAIESYQNTLPAGAEQVYIQYTTEAQEMDANAFFGGKEMPPSGTIASSAFKRVEEIVAQRYASDYDIHIVLATDGDNWREDNTDVIQSIERLSAKLKTVHFLKVSSPTEQGYNTTNNLVSVFDFLSKRYGDAFTTSKVDLPKPSQNAAPQPSKQ